MRVLQYRNTHAHTRTATSHFVSLQKGHRNGAKAHQGTPPTTDKRMYMYVKAMYMLPSRRPRACQERHEASIPRISATMHSMKSAACQERESCDRSTPRSAQRTAHTCYRLWKEHCTHRSRKAAKQPVWAAQSPKAAKQRKSSV